MHLRRRGFLRLALAVLAAPAVPQAARAQGYPTKPVRWLVGFAPAGGNDISARLMGQWLTERLGQSFVIENRPGAGTNIAAEAVVNAPADGYTLFLANVANAINATFYQKLNFNFIRDIAPVAGIVRIPNILLVNPSLPTRTVPELIAYAKASAAKVNMASAGVGSGGHLAGELFKLVTGIGLVHVPYRGNGPATTALLAGEVELLFATTSSAIEFVRAGKLRALAVTGAVRSEALPDVPTVAESVAGYEVTSWHGIGAPKGTPAEVIEKLNRETNAGLVDPKLKARFADLGGITMPGSPGDFGKFIADETEKWGKVIRAANLRAD
jgi:tripartite-type tricarboxylate transporter receptor subunit TctC